MSDRRRQPGLTLAAVRKLGPCDDRMSDLAPLLEGFGRRKITAAQAVEAGVSFDDLVWIASAAARHDKDIERRLRLWMADCAARVLHIYEKQVPDDPRVRTAIETARQYARGEVDAAARAAAGDAARAAARDAAGAAAWDAAGAAAWDAAWAAARDAAGAAAWDAAGDAAWDAAWAAAWDAARAAEEKWQLDRLVARLSNPEPADWPLDKAEG